MRRLRGSPGEAVFRVLVGGLLVACASLPVFFHDLWNPDEPRIAHLAWSMLDHGTWILPEVNGETFIEQPPLHACLVAGAMSVFGHGFDRDWVPRLPSIVFNLLTLWLVHRVARRHLGLRSAWLAPVLLLTTVEYFVGFQRAIVDTSLAFFVTVGMAQYTGALVDGAERPIGWTRALWLGAAAGLAFLSKNLVGVVFLGLVGAALLARHRRVFLVRPAIPRLAAGVAVGLAIVLPWLVAAGVQDPAALRVLLWDNTVGRFFRKDIHNPPFFEFLHRSLAVLCPWVVLAAWGHIARGVEALRGRAGDRDGSTVASGAGALAVERALLWWLVLPWCLVLLSGSKREIYLLPVTPAVALAAAAALDRWAETVALRRAALVAVGLLAPAVPLVALAGGILARPLPEPVWVYLVVHLATLLVFWRARRRREGRSALGVVAVLLLTTLGSLTPVVYRARNERESYVPLARDLALFRERGYIVMGADLPLREKSALPYYLGVRVPQLSEPELSALTARGESPAVVICAREVPEALRGFPYRRYRVRRRIYLVEIADPGAVTGTTEDRDDGAATATEGAR